MSTKAKNPQQNISTSNSTTYYKDHIPYSSYVYTRNASMTQYLQINQCERPSHMSQADQLMPPKAEEGSRLAHSKSAAPFIHLLSAF